MVTLAAWMSVPCARAIRQIGELRPEDRPTAKGKTRGARLAAGICLPAVRPYAASANAAHEPAAVHRLFKFSAMHFHVRRGDASRLGRAA